MNRSHKGLFIICLLLGSAIFSVLPSVTCSAQEGYQKRIYSQDNGLSHNFVQSITRDSTGFLWIATWDGLSRFDGYEFRNYYHKPNDPASFPFFIPSKVLTDGMNNVWILTQERPAVIYNRTRDSFMPAFPESVRDRNIGDMTAGRDGNIWLTLDTSVCEIDVKKRICTSYRIYGEIDSFVNQGLLPQIAIDNTGMIWLFYFNKYDYLIYRGKPGNGNPIFFTAAGILHAGNYSSSKLHNDLGCFDFYTGDDGSIHLFSKYGLFRYNEKSKSFLEVDGTPDPSYFDGKPYYVWAADGRGIFIIDTEKRTLTNLPAANGNSIESVYIDKSGLIWSGDVNPSRDGIGLTRYRKIPEHFRHFLTGKNENNNFHLVFPILKDRFDRLWVGARYSDRLFRIDTEGRVDKIGYPARKWKEGLSRAACLAADSSGIWIGTTGGQIIYFDFMVNKASVKFPARIKSCEDITLIHNIIKDGSRIILNADKGVYTFNIQTGSMKLCYNHTPEGSGFSLVPDGKDGFWIGTFGNRIIHLDSSFNQTGDYKLGPENNIAEHICPGDSNDVWVALMGGGIGHLYPVSGKTEFFTSENGLSNNVTYSIVKDKKGKLWISTNEGISSFDPATRLFRNFGASEGLLIKEFDSDSWFMADDGEIFFGGVGGVVGFYPDEIDGPDDKIRDNVLIFTDFKVSGIARYFDRPVYESDTVVLKKGDNNFQITLVSPGLYNPEKGRYRYRMSGEDTDWIECDARGRNISFANLTHKDYLLEAEMTNENGEWAGKASLLIKIPHRFTELFWVRFGFILVALSGFLAAGIMYYRQIRLKEKQAKDELKLESLRGQMNPHFIFNSLSSINYFISKEDKLSAINYIADFSRLIRSALSNMLSDYIPFEKELESIRDYLKLEHLRFGDKFDYEICTRDVPDYLDIEVFPGMVQPFVENAIWHGLSGLENRKGFVRICFKLNGQGGFVCIVEDDGIGRKLANMYQSRITGHKSRGIEIVVERLRIYNEITKSNLRMIIADLYPDETETGTIVTIDLPGRITDMTEYE